MNLKGTFLIVGSGGSYNTRVVEDGEAVLGAIIELMFGEPANCDEPDYWRNLLADEDNWYSDHDIGPVHCGWDVGETDRIDIYRIESAELQSLRQKLAEAQKENDQLKLDYKSCSDALKRCENETLHIIKQSEDIRSLEDQNRLLRAEIATNKAAKEWIETHGKELLKPHRVWLTAAQLEAISKLRALIPLEEKK